MDVAEFEKLPGIAERLARSKTLKFDPECNAYHSPEWDSQTCCDQDYLNAALFGWNAKPALVSPWVEFDKPELFEQKDSDCLQSKEVFFELRHSGGTYHGWYIARPSENDDRCCGGCAYCECDGDRSDQEYEYFFNANVGDELFDEDDISRWMYTPEPKDSENEE